MTVLGVGAIYFQPVLLTQERKMHGKSPDKTFLVLFGLILVTLCY